MKTDSDETAMNLTAGRRPEAYSPECVERSNLLKNALGARFHPRSETKYSEFGAFRARFVVVISSVPTF
jgi:hypothetical protein